MRPLRPGAAWSAHGGMTTVVLTGVGPADGQGRRPDDELVGLMKTPELAALVCRAVNGFADHGGEDR